MSLSMKIVILTIKSVLWVLRERGRSFGVSLSLSLSLEFFGAGCVVTVGNRRMNGNPSIGCVV